MFIFDGKVKIHATIDETVIRATHRPQDLIPAFLEVIKDTAEYCQIIQHGSGLSSLSQALNSDDDEHEYWESDDCAYFLNEELWEVLNNYAPEGTIFGAHEGDGSDYGYWDPTVADLPDLTKMESQTYANEVDIRKIKKGLTVKIGFDAFPDIEVDGIVTSVANVGEKKRGSDIKIFPIQIVISFSL